MALPAAILFDVDFTLIYPGPRFQGPGYLETCAKHGITVDPGKFADAVFGAAPLLESHGHVYDDSVFELYTQRIIELMGGVSPHLARAAREIFLEWAEHRHFTLYPDVLAALQSLHRRGIRIGLISNTHRCLSSFECHFGLEGLISAAVSSFEHGFMKPHASIFLAALDRLGVSRDDAVMVGDSLVHDVLGARAAGLRGILLARGTIPPHIDPAIPVIRSLDELAGCLDASIRKP